MAIWGVYWVPRHHIWPMGALYIDAKRLWEHRPDCLIFGFLRYGFELPRGQQPTKTPKIKKYFERGGVGDVSVFLEKRIGLITAKL